MDRHGRNGGKLKTGGVHPNSGRPKKLPELDKLLADVLGEEKDGVTAAEVILKKLRQMAANGNLRAAEILLDRGYGKPKQAVDLIATIHERPIFNGLDLNVTPNDSSE